MPFATTWMDLEGIVLSEISQTEKDRYCMISLTCGILKKTKTKKLNSSELQRIDWWWPEAGCNGVGKMDEGGQRYKLPVIK